MTNEEKKDGPHQSNKKNDRPNTHHQEDNHHRSIRASNHHVIGDAKKEIEGKGRSSIAQQIFLIFKPPKRRFVNDVVLLG